MRDATGRVARIVEHKDATAAEREIPEINCGIYCADPAVLMASLKKIRPNNAQGEYYLTDAVHALIAKGATVVALNHVEPEEVLGVNTRAELAAAGRVALRAQGGGAAGRRGHPARSVAHVDRSARPGRPRHGALPRRHRRGRLRHRRGLRHPLGLPAREHGARTRRRGAGPLRPARSPAIGDDVQLGPFAHLRPGSIVEADARVGNFVELKKTRLGKGSKASHLAYLGDAEIGPGCNIGAGTITCNYDGVAKHKTTLGPGVFIGSDTQLVAPGFARRGGLCGGRHDGHRGRSGGGARA